jgi:F1F0 ATPase subunit 2
VQTELIALTAGALLGAIFFGGLWWTVKYCLSGSNPAFWFLASLLLRTSLVLAGFYFTCPYGWQAVMLCLFGFLGARWAVMRFTPFRSNTSHAS